VVGRRRSIVGLSFGEFEMARARRNARVFAFRLLVLLDPRTMHANTALRTDTCTEVVVLVADAAHHARAAVVPRPEGEAVEEGNRAIKIGLRRKVDKRTG